MSMAGRALLQMDQATPSHQEVLRAFRECGEDSNLDSDLCLRSCGHRQEAFGTRAESLHNSTDFECDAFRENPHFTGYFTDGLQLKC